MKYRYNKMTSKISTRVKRETLTLRFAIDNKTEAGVDEAGRGCFWGPLVAGAVIWPAEDAWTDEHRSIAPQIQDSKLISKKKRPVIAAVIRRLAIATGVGVVESSEIDKIGITRANQEAFKRSLSGLTYDRAIIDGILDYDDSEHEIETVIDGDATYLPIAAASILAKVAHDTIISEWCEAHKDMAERYDLMSCMGYGTLRHRNAIKEHGLLDGHRRLFMKNTLPSAGNSCLIKDD